MRRPSDRRKFTDVEVEIDLKPVMNLIVILIPFLLLTAAFVEVTVINVTAPQIGTAPKPEPPDPSKKPPLNLTITMTDKGYSLAGQGLSLGAAEGEAEAGAPAVPKTVNEENVRVFDFEGLTKKLEEVKDAFPDEAKVKISADPDVVYRDIVGTMDAARKSEGDDGERILFDEVILNPSVSG